MRTKEYIQIQVIWVHTVVFTNTHKWFYSKIFARAIQYKSHELFLMSKFFSYMRGEIVNDSWTWNMKKEKSYTGII